MVVFLKIAKSRCFLCPLLFLSVLFLLSSCAQNSVSSTEAIGLLTKCKDFLSFCVLLLSQSDDIHYSHVAERFYYAVLSLARIVAGKDWLLWSEERKGKHERIWRACPKDVEELYGKRLKDLRIRCDYGVEKNDLLEIEYETDLKTILQKDGVYNSLKAAVQEESFEISSRSEFSDEFNSLLDNIDNLHKTVKEKLWPEKIEDNRQ